MVKKRQQSAETVSFTKPELSQIEKTGAAAIKAVEAFAAAAKPFGDRVAVIDGSPLTEIEGQGDRAYDTAYERAEKIGHLLGDVFGIVVA